MKTKDEINLHHRLATTEDLRMVYELYMEPAANPYLTFDPMPLPEFEKIFKELLESKNLFLINQGNDIVASYRIIPKTFRQRHIWYLGSFVVHPAFNGQGIGYQVLQDIESKARQKGIRRIELTVSIENHAAIRLYEKSGYQIEGTIKSNYSLAGSDEYFDEYLMALIIS